MILFQNRLVILDYEPSTDILSVVWPSLTAYDLLEVEQSLRTLVEYIRDYDVKKLLIDSTSTVIDPNLDMGRYEAIVTDFAHSLAKTRLRKSARIIHPGQARETTSRQISEKITKKAQLEIENRNFHNRAEAIAWLMN